MSSKTKVCAVLAAACLVGGSASAQSAKVIPYPADIDITAEGASSAPAEINHADSVYFPLLNFYEMESTDTLTILHHYPTYQQTKEHTCGPAAALTVLYWYGNHDYDEIQLAKEMKTQGYPIGTNPRNMVRFFERIGWQVESTLKAAPISHFNDFHALVQKKSRGRAPHHGGKCGMGRSLAGYHRL